MAVAAALQAQGVDARHLVSIGYGEFCPAVDTADDVDEPLNRRVLLKAVVVNGVWQEVPRGCWRAQARGIDPTRRQAGSTSPASPSAPTVRATGGA